ncbi:MAG: FdhF/YdeP family oxidoreductase [Pseudobacteriovorax sp.]|nr:FdhF/YdeP family oxidoreductase [Pseudobacteriovorax sp.]
MTQTKHGGGWHAIGYTFKKARQVGFPLMLKAMARKNTCKTCALGMGGQKGGMRNELGHFPEFCKKSLQAMASDMQPAIDPTSLQSVRLSELANYTPKQMEDLGRLTFPIFKAKDSDRFERIDWQAALDLVGQKLKDCAPERSYFYASGRSSNEAGFLLQLFCRLFGTNHVNNCSYYCHQASGVGLNASLGTGTSTIALSDLEKTDLLFIIGANPASNHPRLMTQCKNIRRRGGHVVVINPIKETGLMTFSVPSDPISLLKPTEIASDYLQVKPGTDLLLFAAIIKELMENFSESIDRTFIETSTHDFSKLKSFLDTLDTSQVETETGISLKQIKSVASLYAKSKGTVFSWAMGITHHTNGADTVQMIANLALMRGMVAREGAGLLPIRGHSNVQGMGSVGVKPEISADQQKALEDLGVELPTHKGYDTMSCMEAAADGKIDFAFHLGGNLYGSNPDLSFAKTALSKIPFLVQLNTTLNTGHAIETAQDHLVLPVAARDEESQLTSQESMFNFVRFSEGGPRRSKECLPETKIICEIAKRVLDRSRLPHAIDFDELESHAAIRKLISHTLKPLQQLSTKAELKQEFYIPNRLLHQGQFPGKPDHKARFFTPQLKESKKTPELPLTLLTIRSEGQFNTVVYEEDDRYRNQSQRDVILMNKEDMMQLGLTDGDLVKVQGEAGYLNQIKVSGFDIAAGATAMYYPEANILLSRRRDPRTHTPAFKGAKIKVIKL